MLASSLADTLLPDSSIHYKWKEISDLPADIEQFRDRELESLQQVWLEQKAEAENEQRINSFSEELAREWAIETGIIEGVYTLDRGITQTLIERGIDSSYISHDSTNRDPELVARMIRAHKEALEGLFAFVAGGRELSASYIKELHAALLQYQETTEASDQFGNRLDVRLERGVYKKYPNNPTRSDGTVHEYCPAEHVASEMDRLIDIHKQHLGQSVPVLVEATWLHHAFTQIHPFQDGNGRVARSLASLILIKGGFFPLVVHRDDRVKYIEALETADGGDLSPLVSLFARLQKRELTRAIGRAVDAKPVASVDEAVVLTRDLLVHLGKIIPPEYQEAKLNASKLLNVTRNRLSQVATKLESDIARANSQFNFSVGALGGPSADVFRFLAEALKYDPNTADHFQNSLLTFKAHGTSTQIAVCLHGVGAAFRGLIAVVAYFQVGSAPPLALSDDIFRIDYKEPYQDLQERYIKWLEACLIEGLAAWRRTLV